MLTAVVAAASTMYGQGRVNFNNTAANTFVTVTSDSGSAAPGQGATGSGLGSQYSIQLLWAPVGVYADTAAFLAAVLGSSSPTPFNVGGGQFTGGTQPSPVGTSMPAGTYTMAARAWWNDGLFATYNASAVAGNNVGWSGFWNQNATASPTPAPATIGLGSFTVQAVPEPGTLALAGLGAASLLLFRRKK